MLLGLDRRHMYIFMFFYSKYGRQNSKRFIILAPASVRSGFSAHLSIFCRSNSYQFWLGNDEIHKRSSNLCRYFVRLFINTVWLVGS